MDAFFTWLLANPKFGIALGIIAAIVLVAIIVFFVVAFRQGRPITFFPPKIGPEPPGDKKIIGVTNPRYKGVPPEVVSRIFTQAELDEQQWLDTLINRLTYCQKATVYLRYFREPDTGDDQRLQGKQEKIKMIMTIFSKLLIDQKENFKLIGFRNRHWADDPIKWLVLKMQGLQTNLSEKEARAIVDSCVLVIHREPLQNSSTIYLIDDRYLFYNRVSGELVNEKKTYHADDLINSMLPAMLNRGLCDFFDKYGRDCEQ
jgi:hypothetical protein